MKSNIQKKNYLKSIIKKFELQIYWKHTNKDAHWE